MMRLRKLHHYLMPVPILFWILIFAVGCRNETAPVSKATSIIPTPTRELGVHTPETPTVVVPEVLLDDSIPEGWERIQFRKGFLGRSGENALAGFTIALPPDWIVAESWASSTGPAGWIAAPPLKQGHYTPMLTFSIGGRFVYDYGSMAESLRTEITTIMVDGKEAILHLARPHSVNLGPQVGIYFGEMPGSTSGRPAPSLRIDGDSRGFVDQEMLARVLTSVRYEEISELPPLPSVTVTTGDDWERVSARTDFASFTMKIPPGWKFEELRGADSLVGLLSNGFVSLAYDFGSYSSPPYSLYYSIRDGIPTETHLMWEEHTEIGQFLFARPASAIPVESNATGVLVNFSDDHLARAATSEHGTPRLSFHGTGLSGDQQDLVLAMLRTIELEQGYYTRK